MKKRVKRELNTLFRQEANKRVLTRGRTYKIFLKLITATDEREELNT